jgi:hypothetical protein
VTSVLATNIVELGGDGWRLVHYHASRVLGASPGDA